MAIPTFKTLTYETEISDGTIVQYRPYVVKEERQLLIALEAGDEQVVGRAIQSICEACTFGKVNISKLAVYDIEHIFIKMRAKSVGEKIKVSSKCSDCETGNEIEIDLDKVHIPRLKVDNNPRIMVNEDMGMLLRPPTYGHVMAQGSTNKKNSESQIDVLYDMIIKCVDKIFHGDEIFECDKEPRAEVVAFVESLPYEYFMKIKQYIDALPSIEYTIEYDCVKCNKHNNETLSGLSNFFM